MVSKVGKLGNQNLVKTGRNLDKEGWRFQNVI